MIKFMDGIVETEGDSLYFKVRGEGEPLLFIAPGGGNGDVYYPLAPLLAKRYKVITYDRRANTRSTRNFPDAFDIRQQSRDALAVMRAAGEERAAVIGNSSGAVIALDLAAAFPETVNAAVAHEPPVPAMLPDLEAEKWRRFFAECYETGHRKGASTGATKFFFGIQMPAMRLMAASLKVLKYEKADKTNLPLTRISSKEGSEVLIFNELLPVTSFRPDLDALRASGVPLAVACGEYGRQRQTWYARAGKALADVLPCTFAPFPGHHGSFMDRPEAWAIALVGTLEKMAK